MSIEGSWDVTFTTAMGSAQETWTIAPVDGDLRVHSVSDQGETNDAAITVDGNAFSFDVPVPNMALNVTIEGQLDDDRLTGTGRLAAMQIGTFDATRSA